MTRFSIYSILMAAVVAVCACSKNGPVKPAPEPRRPKEVKAKQDNSVPTDCQPTDPRALPPSVSYKERSTIEARNLAEQGFTLLQQAEDSKVPRIERENMVTEAVNLFITALAADPYNVHATYNLAAAYARIGRSQCAVNLLERLVELRVHRSQKDEVEAKLDRLLGRGKYRRRMDPDFRRLRDMEIFREVIKKFCPSLSSDSPLYTC
jgi:tetratricopeptide (TPR) repeat protein